MRPHYPDLEADRREKGYVVIICTVGVDGKASDFAVELMTNPAFAYEAVRAIQQWRWAPARSRTAIPSRRRFACRCTSTRFSLRRLGGPQNRCAKVEATKRCLTTF